MPDLPVVPGEVLGWRAWIVVTKGVREPRLRSLYRDVIWPPDDWLVSDGHGIYAAFDREHLESMHRWGNPRRARYVVEGGAIGRVALAGEIEECERGFRAERARVVSIVLPHKSWELVPLLGRDYGVPVALGNIINRGEMSWT